MPSPPAVMNTRFPCNEISIASPRVLRVRWPLLPTEPARHALMLGERPQLDFGFDVASWEFDFPVGFVYPIGRDLLVAADG